MCRDVGMPLLLPSILVAVVQVVPADYNGLVHLRTMASPCKTTAPNRNSPAERAFLVNVRPFNRLARSFKP